MLLRSICKSARLMEYEVTISVRCCKKTLLKQFVLMFSSFCGDCYAMSYSSANNNRILNAINVRITDTYVDIKYYHTMKAVNSKIPGLVHRPH